MNGKTPGDIRNFALVGHAAAGKTMLAEAMLMCSDTIHRMGTIAQGTTVSDYHVSEQQRHISLHATPLNCEWQGRRFNFIDTPGYLDFSSEAINALTVADFALVVISAGNGIGAGTELMWEYASTYGIPKIIVVTGLDKETGQGERAVVHYTTGAQAVELEVDLETGQIEILKGVSTFDVGKAINPELVKAQMEGGFVQGMSSALFESLQLRNGVVQNPSFVDYRIATTSDIPHEIQTIIVEEAQDDGPWGARGIGEHSMVPTMPAVANAIFNAIGIRMETPPYTAEKIYLAMVDAGIVK